MKLSVKLVKPSLEYKESFLEAVREFEDKNENFYLHGKKPSDDFNEVLQKIKKYEEGKDLPADRVPQTQLWLVEGDKFIGWVKIRHKLSESLLLQGGHIGYSVRPSERKKGYGTKILKLALPVAKSLGIYSVLVTCDDDNVGSVKIIEKNNGVLEDKIQNEGKLKRRYWIENK